VAEVSLHTEDGLTLTSWFVTAGGEPVSTVLVAPGNAGNRSLRLPLARGWSTEGTTCSCSSTGGTAATPARRARPGLGADAAAAHDHLVTNGASTWPLVHLGESLGSAVAARLSADAPRRRWCCARRSPPWSTSAGGSCPFLPVGLLLRDRFETAAALEQVSAPVLVVAGEADRTVPVDLSRRWPRTRAPTCWCSRGSTTTTATCSTASATSTRSTPSSVGRRPGVSVGAAA
jgi:uncharacterized protein